MSSSIEIILLNKKYAEQTVEILTRTFMDEPMQQVLDTTYEDIREFMEHVVRHSISTGLPVIAIDTVTDKVIGVNINKDLTAELIEEEDSFSERLLPIFELLDELDADYHKDNQVGKNEILHSVMLGIDVQYRDKDISMLFFEACAAVGIKEGYKTMMAEVTGDISHYLLTEKMGFKTYSSLKYTDFIYDNIHPFKDIKNAEYCYLVYRPLPKMESLKNTFSL